MPGDLQHAGQAWYVASRVEFVEQASTKVAGDLASAANHSGWSIEPEQQEEWQASVELLQKRLGSPKAEAITTLRNALARPETHDVTDVILEYDFRRRGLRIDCILFAPGAILVIEFKRGNLGAAARDQVMSYCMNLMEFHAETRRQAEGGAVIVPILAQTQGTLSYDPRHPGILRHPYQRVRATPISCDADHLGDAIRDALATRTSNKTVSRARWLESDFSPSSTIIDAAISLYGEHDVSAIREHAAPVEEMRSCIDAIRRQIDSVLRDRGWRIIFLSGAPGAGKTLVGLNLAFHPDLRRDAVFVTGNAPLVDVLDKALKSSYAQGRHTIATLVASGYAKEHARDVIDQSTFKLVKAHKFLGQRGQRTAATDGAVLVFDEAQRTYEKGRRVLGHALPDHEADLILQAMEDSYPDGAVVVALLGQNQAINRGERGATAWFEAAERRSWPYAVADRTLALPELARETKWGRHELRKPLAHGHLGHSMRYYRNAGLERWAHHLMEENIDAARALAQRLREEGDTVQLTRSLSKARDWARVMRVGEERAGIIASSQARRLAALGLHVDLKPDIADWMLAPSDDFRSSNMLETVQNQYRIQGLELDWTIVCWGADLRRRDGRWSSFKLHGGAWKRDKELDVAKNGYRVLLTRARKGMVIFVPQGDATGEDPTRDPAFYDGIATHLIACGAEMLEAG